MNNKKVSILMLTHNAPKYVRLSIESLNSMTKNIIYELIVVDNASHFPTKMLLRFLKKKKMIDKLVFNKENALFAKGNNIASQYVSYDSDYILLLNSDVEIKSEDWLRELVSLYPEGGICSYGVVDDEPIRADGYCMLMETQVYYKHKLDENFAWFWGVTKLEGKVLNEGKEIIAVRNHENFLHHFGGKSGKGFKNAQGMGVDISEVKSWFVKGSVVVKDYIDL